MLTGVWQQVVLLAILSVPSSFCSACQLLSDLITHVFQTLEHLFDLHFIFHVGFHLSSLVS